MHSDELPVKQYAYLCWPPMTMLAAHKVFDHNHKHGYCESFIACLLNTVIQHLYRTFDKWNRFSCIQDKW